MALTCPPPTSLRQAGQGGHTPTPPGWALPGGSSRTPREGKREPRGPACSWHSPIPKAAFCYHPPPPPNTDPWLPLGSPSFPTAHRAQFNNSTIP